MKVIMQCYLITPCSLVKVCLSTNIYVATRSWQTPHMWPSLSCTRWFRCSLIDRRVLKHWLHAVIHHQGHLCNQWIARTEHWWESRGRSLNLPEVLRAEWLSSLSRVYMWTRALISPAPVRSEVSFRSTGSLFYRTGHPWPWQTPTKAITERYAFVPTMAVDGKLTVLNQLLCDSYSPVYFHGGVTVDRQYLWLVLFTVLKKTNVFTLYFTLFTQYLQYYLLIPSYLIFYSIKCNVNIIVCIHFNILFLI